MCLLFFLTVRSSAQIRNFSNTPFLGCTSATSHPFQQLVVAATTLVIVVAVAVTAAVDIVALYQRWSCVCAIREHLLFSSSLSFSFIASLVLTKTKCSLNYATTTTTKKFTPASKCVSVCLLVGTGADRKITTADRGVFTLFKLGPPTPTLFDCAPCACVCVFWQDLR